MAYGGTLRFRVRAQYGDFLELTLAAHNPNQTHIVTYKLKQSWQSWCGWLVVVWGLAVVVCGRW